LTARFCSGKARGDKAGIGPMRRSFFFFFWVGGKAIHGEA
jgi:hypothetical protein